MVKSSSKKRQDRESDDDVALLSPKQPEERLGRGCRVSRPITFYEDERTPRRITRSMTKAARNTASGRRGDSDDGDEENDTMMARRGREPRAAAVQALRELNGDASEDSSGSESTYTAEVNRSRRPRSSKLKRHSHSNLDDVDDDAFRSDHEGSDEIDGRVDEDTDSSDGVTNVTRAEAVALTKKRGSINAVLSRSKGLAEPFSGATGVAERDLARRTASKRGRDSGSSPWQAAPAPASGPGGAESNVPTAAELGDVSALEVDRSITFASVGGLPTHIIALRECVLIPLLYPALMERLQLRPPRGMLFVGPPGTGKTLMARALANEGRAHGRSITFFMRKGADILSKWVGESERQLRLLFDEARKRQPSVIFFDELDGLAPVRHSKQEQSHAALVSTLLALLDGLDDRGQVVVIGATNRVDTIDPALRRPGRFDRELQFPLPDAPARRHILRLQLNKFAAPDGESAGQCAIEGADAIVERLVRETQGFSGADLAALGTEASLCALRRSIPQIFATSSRLKLPEGVNKPPGMEDFTLALRRLQPSVHRLASAQDNVSLDPVLEDLNATIAERASSQLAEVWPPAAAALRAQLEATEDIAKVAARLVRVPALVLPSQVCLLIDPATSQAPHLSRLHPELTLPDARDAKVAAIALTRVMPTIPVRTFHLPLMGHAGTSAETLSEFDGLRSGGNSNTLLEFCASLRRCAPCFALILGFDEWAAGSPDGADMAHIRYCFSTLTGSDVAVIVPATRAHHGVARQLWPGFTASVLQVHGTVLRDAVGALGRACGRMLDAAMVGAGDPATWDELEIDDSVIVPRAPKRTAEERAEMRARWDRIQYKRTQLRHILRSWLMTIITNKTYSILCDKDLDLDPEEDAEELKQWRNHTRGRRIGLTDILEKLDNAEYTCLSQYNDDIDTLHGNVHGFYSHRDPRGLRYRTRATQLRDATILNNHKIHPNLIAFTEETKDDDEPLETSSDDTDEEEGDQAHEVVQPKRRPPRRRRRRVDYDAPRRKKRPAPKAEPQSESDSKESGSEGSAHSDAEDDAAEAVKEEGEKAPESVPSVVAPPAEPAGPASVTDVVAQLEASLRNALGDLPLDPQKAELLPVGTTSIHEALGRALHSWTRTHNAVSPNASHDERALLREAYTTLANSLIAA